MPGEELRCCLTIKKVLNEFRNNISHFTHNKKKRIVELVSKIWTVELTEKGHVEKVTQRPCIITWGKRTFYSLRLRAFNGINLIMFRDSSVTFTAKIRKKLKCAF